MNLIKINTFNVTDIGLNLSKSAINFSGYL